MTPLTNAGSICTVPDDLRVAFDLDGPSPAIDEFAAFLAEHTMALRPQLISGVGFCLLVTRAALDACGPFDEETFGRGYGEEVDFCLRASARGFIHLADDATFIHHRGAGSFGDTSSGAMQRASVLVRERHPHFKMANRRERANDPLAPTFAALRADLHPRDPTRPHVLHILHAPSRYGGTEMHLDALTRALAPDLDATLLYPSPHGFVLRSTWRSPDGVDRSCTRLVPGTPDPSDDGPSDDAAAPAAALRTTLDLLDVSAVHIHNLIGHPLTTLRDLGDFPGPVVCSVHDLYLVCPNHSLLYKGVSPCGVPGDLDVCGACLPVTRDLTRADLEAHRRLVTEALPAIDHWVVFSQSAADHLQQAYPIPSDRLRLIPHGSLVSGGPPPLDESVILEGPLDVAFVGRGWAKKGLDVVNRAADRLGNTADVRLHHFGEIREPLSPRVRPHGAYDNTELSSLLHAEGIAVVLIPGPYAETFGFVMSEALQAGLPVIGPYYGATGERIRRHDAGWTIDPEDEDSLPTLLADLSEGRIEVLRATRQARTIAFDAVARSADQYAALYLPPAEHPHDQDTDRA